MTEGSVDDISRITETFKTVASEEKIMTPEHFKNLIEKGGYKLTIAFDKTN